MVLVMIVLCPSGPTDRTNRPGADPAHLGGWGKRERGFPTAAALTHSEPKTLRYRVLHAAGKLVRGGRRRRLKIPAAWPWAQAIATAWARITALPQAP
jgi:hypothetical protein